MVVPLALLAVESQDEAGHYFFLSTGEPSLPLALPVQCRILEYLWTRSMIARPFVWCDNEVSESLDEYFTLFGGLNGMCGCGVKLLQTGLVRDRAGR